MIYELRSSRTRMGGVREMEERMAEALPRRQVHSSLAGAWHTEIGPLFHVVELWPYEDEQHYAEVARAVALDGGWPPTEGDLLGEGAGDDEKWCTRAVRGGGGSS